MKDSMQADFFWSIRSPYVYFILPRMLQLVSDYDIDLRTRVVRPIALRDPQALRSLKSRGRYFMNDVVRTAEFLGMPLGWPDPDPVPFDPTTGEPAAEQPYIDRLLRLAAAADEAGCGLSFAHEMLSMIMTGKKNWIARESMSAAVRCAGLDLNELDRQIREHAKRFDAILDANEEAQRKAGHHGVPLMVFDGEAFFGQDRFDQFVWRLQQRGLQRR